MTTIAGPHGIRKAIPIVGGNFSGPHLCGTSTLYFRKMPNLNNPLTTAQAKSSASAPIGV
jgi:hypothetical protein